ncbi:MAG TPA: BCD family MFS transporter, partial [Pseudomonadota bacterium]|nr:BCD family MFS transporter [Pseudomonadota bacterium]
MQQKNFGWFSIFRIGLVQTALGAVVVLTTSTLNRVMVVELALPAMLPGLLVTLHYAMQLLRPRMGYGSDLGQRRTPYILGGMAALAAGGTGAAGATALMTSHFALGVALAGLSFALIGGGVSACGTSLLVLLAKRVAAERRAASATLVWMMMIAGFAVTATIAGKLLDPFSAGRLLAVTGGVSAAALLVTLAAVYRVEGAAPRLVPPVGSAAGGATKAAFLLALREVWAEADARRFTLFIFISMLSYSAQDLILEPFAGSRFAFTPGQSTRLSGVQHGGVFAGMLLVAAMTTLYKGRAAASLRGWVVGGCVASAVAMAGLVVAGVGAPGWPLRENVFALGVANGAFSIAAIGAMMTMASQGQGAREGVRMGLWGASQAIAFGGGGFVGTVLADLARWWTGSAATGYALVFALEGIGFVAAAWIALGIALGKPVVAGTVTLPISAGVH